MVADDVQGTVSLRLRGVTIRTALDVVLSSRALGMELDHDVLRVAPLKQLADEAAQRVRLAHAKKLERPVQVRIIAVNNARAADLAPIVQGTLTEKGSVSVDARTNSLIVRDIE